MNLSRKHVMVTGGAGFIGSHLVDKLISLGSQVTVVDNFMAGSSQNLPTDCDSFKIVNADIRDPQIFNAYTDVDIIFHLGANANVPYSIKRPDYDFSTNIIGTYNVYQFALAQNIEKILFASSAAIYGDPEYTPMDEMHPKNPKSPYGVSKLSGEQLGLVYHSVFDLPFVGVRIFNTYGPRQSRYVMFDLLKKILSGTNELEVLGTGNQIRDFCYVSDTVDALILLMQSNQSKGEIYNIGSGNEISIKDLVYLLLKLTDNNENVDVKFTGTSWKGDIERLIPSISKIQDIGFISKVGLDEGVTRLIKYMSCLSD